MAVQSCVETRTEAASSPTGSPLAPLLSALPVSPPVLTVPPQRLARDVGPWPEAMTSPQGGHSPAGRPNSAEDRGAESPGPPVSSGQLVAPD